MHNHDNVPLYAWEALYYILVGYTKHYNNYSYSRITGLPKNASN